MARISYKVASLEEDQQKIALRRLRQQFKERCGRDVTLTDDEIIALDDGSDCPLDEWIEAMEEVELEKGKKPKISSLKKPLEETVQVSISAKNSPESLADKINKDHDADTLALTVFQAGELGRRAPAQCAIILRNHYTADELTFFAVPYSDQKKGTDGDGNKLMGNEIVGYVWDYYQRSGKNGQWYLNYVDRTETGVAINKILNAIDKMDDDKTVDTNVMLDGDKVDLKKIIPPERVKLRRTYDRRRRSLARLYRTAVQIINMWQAIRDSRFGVGGKVDIDWVWANSQDKTQGLARGDCPIRLKELNPTNGQPTGEMLDMSVNEFLNLDINVAGNTYQDLINSKKEKPDKTKKGQGQTQETKQHSRLDSKEARNSFYNLADWCDDEESANNFNRSLLTLKTPEELEHVSYSLVRVHTWLAGFITEEMRKLHDKVVNDQGKDAQDRIKVRTAAASLKRSV